MLEKSSVWNFCALTQTSFGRETSGSVAKSWQFSQTKNFFFCIAFPCKPEAWIRGYSRYNICPHISSTYQNVYAEFRRIDRIEDHCRRKSGQHSQLMLSSSSLTSIFSNISNAVLLCITDFDAKRLASHLKE